MEGLRNARPTMMRNYYRSPSDQMDLAMDFEAGADFARLNFRLGLEVANAPSRPAWNKGDFFGTGYAR